METLLSYSPSDLLLFSRDTYLALLSQFVAQQFYLYLLVLVSAVGCLSSKSNFKNNPLCSQLFWLTALSLSSLLCIVAFYFTSFALINPYSNWYIGICLCCAPMIILLWTEHVKAVSAKSTPIQRVKRKTVMRAHSKSTLTLLLLCLVIGPLQQLNEWTMILSPAYLLLIIIYCALMIPSFKSKAFILVPITLFVVESTTLHLLSFQVWHLILGLIHCFIVAALPYKPKEGNQTLSQKL